MSFTPAYRIELFGGLRLGREVPVSLHFRTRRVAALLARLAYSGRMESRETLIEWLWPDCDWEAGRNRLSVTLSSLRRTLQSEGIAELLHATHADVGFAPGALPTDVAAFDAAYQEAAASHTLPHKVDQALWRAIELYQGPLLPDLHDDWIAPERARLAERFFRVVCRLEERSLEERSVESPSSEVALAAVIEQLQRAVWFEPAREDVARALMRSYSRIGQTARALRCYRDLERALQADAGEPAPSTRQLYARLLSEFRGVPPALEAPATDPQNETPRVLPLAGSLENQDWPLPRNAFFGRAEELRQLVDWAFAPRPAEPAESENARRLLTLTGSGGRGKTRLVLEVIRAGLTSPDLMLDASTPAFVPLLDVNSAQDMAGAVLKALKAPLAPRQLPLDAAIEALNCQPTLVILDNFEHLVGEGSALVAQLVEGAPLCRFLVTSQRRLGLQEEREMVVGPLLSPELHARDKEQQDPFADEAEITAALANESVQLFVARAQMARPNFELKADNARAIVQVCRALEGMPLALELAASRARALAPEQMLRSLHARLDFLRQREGVVPTGMGSKDTDSTHVDLPDPRHQSLRATLAWSYELLSPEAQECLRLCAIFQGGWTLEGARAVCFPTLGEAQVHEIHEQLCEYSLLETQEHQGTLRFRFLEAVREYALERAAQEESSSRWAALRQRHAGYFRDLAESACQPLRTTHSAVWIVTLAAERANLRAALGWGLEMEPLTALRLVVSLWWFWFVTSDLTEGRSWLERALQCHESEAQGDPNSPPKAQNALSWHAEALCGAGFLAWRQGDFAQAGALSARGLELGRQAKNRRAIAYSIIVVLMTRLLSNDFATMKALGAECLQLCRELDDQMGQGFALHLLAAAHEYGGELKPALVLHEQSVALFRALGSQDGLAYTLLNLGNARRRNGEAERALRDLDECLTLFRDISSGEGEVYARLYRAFALAESDARAALAWYRESLQGCVALDLLWGLAQNLEGIALALGEDSSVGEDSSMIEPLYNGESVRKKTFALNEDFLRRAVRLWSAAQAVRETIGAQRPPVDEPRAQRFLSDLRLQLDEASFQAAWQTGRDLTREQVLRDALTP